MANFYIVMGETTAWGVGKTKEQALQDAAQRVPIKEMEALIESRHEVENGSGGYYLAPIRIIKWDDTLVDASSDALARLVWEQLRHIFIAPIPYVVDVLTSVPAVRVARWINSNPSRHFPIELIAASYAFHAADDAGKGFSKAEIEYHLNALVAAQANFDYGIARGLAIAIVSCSYLRWANE